MKFKVRDKSGREFKVEELADEETGFYALQINGQWAQLQCPGTRYKVVSSPENATRITQATTKSEAERLLIKSTTSKLGTATAVKYKDAAYTANDELFTSSYGDDDDGLSSEEIASLKQLAAVADKLVSLANTTTDEDEIEDEEEEIEEIEDEEEEQIEDEEEEQIEEVIDTSKKKTADSIKKSAIAIEKKIKTDDSLDKDAVSDAWAKRYGGNK